MLWCFSLFGSIATLAWTAYLIQLNDRLAVQLGAVTKGIAAFAYVISRYQIAVEELLIRHFVCFVRYEPRSRLFSNRMLSYPMLYFGVVSSGLGTVFVGEASCLFGHGYYRGVVGLCALETHANCNCNNCMC